MQIFIENFAFFVGQFFKAGKSGIERFFALQFDAQIGKLGFKGIAAGKLAQAQAVGGPAHALCRHDFISFAVFEHTVLVNARFVCKCIGAHNGFIGLHRIAGNGRHELGSGHNLGGVHAGFEAEHIVAGFKRHHDFFQAGIARALAQTVNGAFHLARAAEHGSQRVAHGQAQIIVAMRRPHHFVAARRFRNQLAEKGFGAVRHRIAHGVGNIDGGGAGFNHRAADFSQKADFRAQRIFAGKFHIIGVFLGDFHRFHRRFNHLLGLHFQLVLHMDGAGGDKSVDAALGGRCHRFAGGADIALHGAAERAHSGAGKRFGDFVDRFEITRAGRSKARFNHIHAQLFQLARNADFFFFGHGGTGRLLAVAQRGVEYDNAIIFGHVLFLQSGLLLHKSIQIQRPALRFGQRRQLLQLIERQRAARAPFINSRRAGRMLRVLLLERLGQRIHAAEISD